jgi:hypothetical protein
MKTCNTRKASNDELDVSSHRWPTTQRFSRRLGETHRGVDYARATEPADDCPVMDLGVATMRFIAASVLTALAAIAIVLCAAD